MARVLLFGRLADVAGWRERESGAITLAALRAELCGLDAALAEALAGRGVQAVVDQTLVRGDMALTATSEVAFLPPMSGG